jgi:hypothetical protein
MTAAFFIFVRLLAICLLDVEGFLFSSSYSPGAVRQEASRQFRFSVS